ncbi:hypothetical protein [Saccharomonospora piscinae]|uniref:hypothetical protein n=1 Tax=Saccharomonospora piscinae TaxID=687388 RepID=UPI0012DF8688|nr:hypothetical protein [Saccharomonospora piscinae]
MKDHQDRANVLRRAAQRKQAEAAAESRAAVQELLSMGLSQREAGDVLGVSFQRVSQLAKSSYLSVAVTASDGGGATRRYLRLGTRSRVWGIR